jgi:formylglycine-generating enzyme required for sulfatase activity
MKALAKERERRYSSAAELAMDIRRHLRHEPVLARPPSVTYRLGKFLKRNRIGVAATAVVLLLVSALAAVNHEVAVRRSIARGRDLLSEGTQRAGEHAALRERLPRLAAAWEEERERGAASRPIWERAEELARWREHRSAERELEDSFNAAERAFHSALEVLPPGGHDALLVGRAIDQLYYPRLKDALMGAPVRIDPEWIRRLMEERGAGTYTRELEGKGTVSIASDPPGAEVYCFLYVEHEGRLVPLPYRPGEGVVGEPFLEVGGAAAGSVFLPGDRILTVEGKPVRSLTDLAQALSGVSWNETASGAVVREGATVPLSWTPFRQPEDAAGAAASTAASAGASAEPRFADPGAQLGLAFSGYPLDFREANRIGVTMRSAALEVELPKGSYLLVLRTGGDYPDVRYPVLVAGEDLEETVKLLRREEIPEGFVYVPAGLVRTGGDPAAFQPFAWGSHRVGGVLVSRREVTLEEWTAFLNGAEAEGRILVDKEGVERLRPQAPDVLGAVDELGPQYPALRNGLKLFGSARVVRMWQRDAAGRWTLAAALLEHASRVPVPGVHQLLAREYAYWRTQEAVRAGEPWRFRLPAGLEWERAARGADRRLFVWGDYPYFGFAWCLPGGHKQLGYVEQKPFDESPFGVRDLIGSQSEQTSDQPKKRYGLWAYRGGSWNQLDEFYFNIASRHAMLPFESHEHTGLRLVAELASETVPGG